MKSIKQQYEDYKVLISQMSETTVTGGDVCLRSYDDFRKSVLHSRHKEKELKRRERVANEVVDKLRLFFAEMVLLQALRLLRVIVIMMILTYQYHFSGNYFLKKRYEKRRVPK